MLPYPKCETEPIYSDLQGLELLSVEEVFAIEGVRQQHCRLSLPQPYWDLSKLIRKRGNPLANQYWLRCQIVEWLKRA